MNKELELILTKDLDQNYHHAVYVHRGRLRASLTFVFSDAWAYNGFLTEC